MKIGSLAETRSFAASASFTALWKYSKWDGAMPPWAASSPSKVESSQENSPRCEQQSVPTAQNSTRFSELGSRIGATQYTTQALYPTDLVVSILASAAKVIFPASACAAAGSEGRTFLYSRASYIQYGSMCTL